jgi:hypothetical protein
VWLLAAGLLAALLVIAAFIWRDDILEAALDPKVPYQTYEPPRAPDFADFESWALLPPEPDRPSAKDPPVDVFFVHPTTYDGGSDWNAPIRQRQADRTLHRVMLPNYAGPFQRTGRVFVPHYRQASLYSFMNMRDDARDARIFAYGDVAAAFRAYLARFNHGRPIVLAGVEQGATLVARLARETAADPELKKRLVAVYLIDTAVPRADYGPKAVLPACTSRAEAGCVVGWIQVFSDNPAMARRLLDRAMVWTSGGSLDLLDGPALCVNPLLGAETEVPASAQANLGAANATGLEWGVRPAFLSHEVSAQCRGGVLMVSPPRSPSLRPSGSWADRKKAPDYNLFYADIEADAKARQAVFQARQGAATPASP